MDFLVLPSKICYGVDELPLPRNARKRTKNKNQEKKSRWVGGWVRGSKLVTGPLGSVAGDPERRQRQLLCLLPAQAAGSGMTCEGRGPRAQPPHYQLGAYWMCGASQLGHRAVFEYWGPVFAGVPGVLLGHGGNHLRFVRRSTRKYIDYEFLYAYQGNRRHRVPTCPHRVPTCQGHVPCGRLR
jgi:hypothetical protein